MIRVRLSAQPVDAAACTAIVESLPAYFDDHAVRQVPRDVEAHGAWLLAVGEEVVSFVVVERRWPAAEILGWRHGRSFGATAMVGACSSTC